LLKSVAAVQRLLSLRKQKYSLSGDLLAIKGESSAAAGGLSKVFNSSLEEGKHCKAFLDLMVSILQDRHSVAKDFKGNINSLAFCYT